MELIWNLRKFDCIRNLDTNEEVIDFDDYFVAEDWLNENGDNCYIPVILERTDGLMGIAKVVKGGDLVDIVSEVN